MTAIQVDKYLQRKYGVSLKWYLETVKEQGYACGVCKKHKSKFKRALSVDHNHKTGKVRGLLCYRCNRFLVGRHTMKTATALMEYFNKYDSES